MELNLLNACQCWEAVVPKHIQEQRCFRRTDAEAIQGFLHEAHASRHLNPTRPSWENSKLNAKNIPFQIHPNGSGSPFCSSKTRGLRKSLQNDWVPRIFCPYKMVGPCASTTSFQHPSILYGGILSPDVRSCLFLEYEFCLHAWTLCPKKGTIL